MMKLSPKKTSFQISLGNRGETAGWEFLRRNSFFLLEKNFRCSLGEIDVIARKGRRIYFIEIKTRTSDHYGDPAEAVSYLKQRRIIRIAQLYLKSKRWEDVSVSFSVMAVYWQTDDEPRIRFIEEAFDADALQA